MRQIYKGYNRIRCDVCGKLIPIKDEGRLVRDAISNDTKDVCSPSCADRYWAERYQLSLWAGCPSSNTGVVLVEKGQL